MVYLYCNWRSIIDLLEQSWRNPGEVSEQSRRIAAALPEQIWRNPGAGLVYLWLWMMVLVYLYRFGMLLVLLLK